MRLNYENTEVNGVRVLRRDTTSSRHWICKCPLCHDEFAARTDSLTNGTVKNCGKHSKAHHARIARDAERTRLRSMLRSEPSTPEDDAEYGVVQELNRNGTPVRDPAAAKAKARAKREAAFRARVFPGSLLRALERVADENGHQYWIFECACGTKVKAMRDNVVAGRKKSCGCIARGRPAGSKNKPKDGPPTISSPKAFLDLWK